MPRIFGHKKGAESTERLIKNAKEKGVQIVTIFAFSTENWSRPKHEIKMLFSYFKEFLLKKKETLHQQKVRLRFIGRRSRFEPSFLEVMEEVERYTAGNSDFLVNVAFDYGGRWDITQAAVKVGEGLLEGRYALEDINESLLSQHLSLFDIPYPDLLFRTSGELRVSNFFLWQLAYAEFYFTHCLWPDFDERELEKAIGSYSQRRRRFGKISVE